METRQSVLFSTLYLSYFLSYVSRKSIVFIAPYLISLGTFSQSDLGASQSTFSLCYTLSKLCSNIVCNWACPRKVLAVGIAGVGLVNILAGVLCNTDVLWLLWGCNGLFCGICWPPIAVLIIKSYSVESRGKAWSLMSTSMNAGATLSPIMTDLLVMYSSWQMAFIVPGVLDVLIAVAVLVLIQPKEPEPTPLSSSSTTPNVSNWEWAMVFNPFMLLICLAYAILTFGVISVGTWGQMYFMRSLDVSTLTAGAMISGYEIGGFCGASLSGVLADWLAKHHNQKSSPRSYCALLFAGIAGVAHISFHYIPKSVFLAQISCFMFGAGAFGSISMFGLMTREYVPVDCGGSLSAMIAVAAQVGGFSAGSPLAMYNEYSSIYEGFWVVSMCMPVAVLSLSLLTKLEGVYVSKSKTE